jgi:hypothetical protein
MDDDKMALFVNRFCKFMVKKGHRARRKKSSSKSKDEARRCFKCNSKNYLITECLYNSDNDGDNKKSKKNDKKEKKDKMTFKKKKGGSYVVTWDSDASSSDDDDDSDDDMTTKKRALASIAINEKPSLFDTPSTCFMAKATKVQFDDECEHDKNESDSDDDDELTKDELIDMLEDVKTHFDIKRRECKDLRKELKALKQAFDELNATNERLQVAHEKLGKAHSKLEKAHSSLVEQHEIVFVTCDVGLTCDIIDESFYKPIMVALANPSYSSSRTTTTT